MAMVAAAMAAAATGKLKTSGLMFQRPLNENVQEGTKGGTIRDMAWCKYLPLLKAHEDGSFVAAKTNYGSGDTMGYL